MNSYRELTAPELVTWFAKLTASYINKGRDAHMLSQYMKTHGCTPTQVLLGIFEFRNSEHTKDIPTFLRGDWPLGEDLLMDEAELVLHLTGQPPPHFYIIYRDLIDLDMLDAGFERSFQDAKAQLQEWVDAALSKTPTRPKPGRGRP